MSSPLDATGTRQRGTKTPEVFDETKNTSNPNSLSMNSDKRDKVSAKKAIVKPPFADVTMGKFLTYLVLALVALAAFYTWRLTVWAAQAGGYWNLMTGRAPPPGTGAAEVMASAAASKAAGGAASAASAVSGAASAASGVNKKASKGGKPSPDDIQSQIFRLAESLGVKPADLNSAIRPLFDPSVPNPAEAAQKEIEMLKQQLELTKVAAANGNGAQEEAATSGGLLAAMGEVLLD